MLLAINSFSFEWNLKSILICPKCVNAISPHVSTPTKPYCSALVIWISRAMLGQDKFHSEYFKSHFQLGNQESTTKICTFSRWMFWTNDLCNVKCVVPDYCFDCTVALTQTIIADCRLPNILLSQIIQCGTLAVIIPAMCSFGIQFSSLDFIDSHSQVILSKKLIVEQLSFKLLIQLAINSKDSLKKRSHLMTYTLISTYTEIKIWFQQKNLWEVFNVQFQYPSRL